MIFELPDIFFGSHKKRKGITTTAGETVRIYKKGRKSLTTSGFFKKSGDIFFGATSQKILIHHLVSEDFSVERKILINAPTFETDAVSRCWRRSQTLPALQADSNFWAPQEGLG